MSDRLTKLTPERVDARQAALYERIVGGSRARVGLKLADAEGGLLGPWNAYLHAPEIGELLEPVGVALRDAVQLAPRLREIAILASARYHRAQFEWFAHERIARAAGLEDPYIARIHRGEDPAFADPADAAVYAFAVELLETHEIGDSTWQMLCDQLDEQERVELVLLLGHYALVSMVLNVFRVPLPEGEALPFE
jgi:4-carboxymuconolactone decarboxylase